MFEPGFIEFLCEPGLVGFSGLIGNCLNWNWWDFWD